MGPHIHPADSYLPDFGGSNPPPNVWEAYNLLVLDVNTPCQASLVRAFVRCHSLPYTTPESRKRSPVNKENPLPIPVGSREEMPNLSDRWKQDQARRIPRYSYDTPGSVIEPIALDETRLADILNTQRPLLQNHGRPFAAGMGRISVVEDQHPTAHHQQVGHRHSTIRASNAHIHHAPTQLPNIGEVVDQGLLPTPLFGNQHDGGAERSIRFADDMDWEANEGRHL